MRIAVLAWLAIGTFSSVALAQRADDPSEPLSDAMRRIAEDVPDEHTPPPPEHYPISNEHRHDLFSPYVRDLGGAFVGVGTDQCYTIAAMQNASLVWIVDFDPLVPLVHRMYGALVPVSEDAATLVSRFSPEERRRTRALLLERLASDPARDQIVSAFVRDRDRIHRYLTRAQRHVVDGVGASWVSDPELYRRVRTLFLGGRVIARNGDVTADGAMRAIGRAAARLGVPVRVVYFSNAEEFFPFSRSFRDNLEGLPTDPRSLVLRTFRQSGAPYPRGDRWHYMVEPVSDLRARIDESGYRRARQIVTDLLASHDRVGARGVSFVDGHVRRRFAQRASAR